MTREQGKVILAVNTPAFGTVTGTKTMEELSSGKPASDGQETPPVVCRALGTPPPAAGGDKPTAVADKPADTPKNAPAPAAAPAATPAAAPAIAQAPPPAPAAAPPAAPAVQDDAAKANGLLKLAENYINAGMKPKALAILRDIQEKYPTTDAAKAASGLIAKCQ